MFHRDLLIPDPFNSLHWQRSSLHGEVPRQHLKNMTTQMDEAAGVKVFCVFFVRRTNETNSGYPLAN